MLLQKPECIELFLPHFSLGFYFFFTDFLDLVYPEAIEEARSKIIGALHSYEMGMTEIFLYPNPEPTAIKIFKTLLSRQQT